MTKKNTYKKLTFEDYKKIWDDQSRRKATRLALVLEGKLKEEK